MMEDTDEEAFVRNEYSTEKLHEDFKQLILERKEKKRQIETLEIIKKGKETLELWNELKTYF